VDLDEVLAVTFSLVGPHLTERQRRLLLGAAARALGYGGVSRVARLAEASRPTSAVAPPSWTSRPTRAGASASTRVPSGGATPIQACWWRWTGWWTPTAAATQSPLRWTCKSTRQLAETLTAHDHPVSDDTVGRLLREQGYRLQRTVKTLAGAKHPTGMPSSATSTSRPSSISPPGSRW
jgi:hypothetical protein